MPLEFFIDFDQVALFGLEPLRGQISVGFSVFVHHRAFVETYRRKLTGKLSHLR